MSDNNFLATLNNAGCRQDFKPINSHWSKFCFFARLAELPDPNHWNVNDFAKELVGKHADWLVTKGKAGKPLQSYRLCTCGLKTKIEQMFPSTHETSVFHRDPNWYAYLFRGAKKIHNKSLSTSMHV